MQDGDGVAGVPGPDRRADAVGFAWEDAPVTPRTWRCQHCGAEIVARVKATFNGAPLCVPRTSEDPSCYRMVSMLNHQMPCLGDPCPGEVAMDHVHVEGDSH